MNHSTFWRCFFLLLGASVAVLGWQFLGLLANLEAALAVAR